MGLILCLTFMQDKRAFIRDFEEMKGCRFALDQKRIDFITNGKGEGFIV